MGLLTILTFPDPRLREKANEVTVFDAQLQQFAKDMLETMYHSRGIGLAATQVGELKRLLVVDTRPKEKKEDVRYENDAQTELELQIKQPLVLINPKLIAQVGKTTFDEGCLSVPSYYETVERSETIEIEYQDVFGKVQRLKTDGLLAICIQHEMDHLDGTLFIDHLSFVKGKRIKDQIKKYGYPEKNSESDKKEISEKGKVTI